MNNKDMCAFLFLSFLHLFQTSVFGSGTQGEKTNDCSKQEFKCDNGQCVDKSFRCDGILDCVDKSDETRHHCSNTTCGHHFFRCEYGGCIEEKYRCDNLKQCHDGSDELARMCSAILNRDKETGSKINGDMCTAFEPFVDKTISYDCKRTIPAGKQNRRISCEKNGLLQETTIAVRKCKSGFYPINETNSRSICSKGKWIPPIESCTKRCEKLTPRNDDLKCYYDGLEISCNANSFLPGTKVRPKRNCRPNHIQITCTDDGKWDNPSFFNASDCDQSPTIRPKGIARGLTENVERSPWHVAVFNRKKELICGGTIIHPKLILSAAHCFEDVAINGTRYITDYEIIVSKFTRNYSIVDNENQKTYKIKDIRFPAKGYTGLNSNYAADVAILIFERNITFNPTVSSAHINWESLIQGEYPPEGTLGKVAGWGLDETGEYSENLMAVNLPFISRARCLSAVPADFKAYITFDKFCAGSDEESSPSVLRGDSGGGLFFQKEDIFYLQGIVSVKQTSSTSIAAFTDLSDHARWILSVINEIEPRGSIQKRISLCSIEK